ncbi:MAG: SdpI family protein [Pseudomonadota bacterium]
MVMKGLKVSIPFLLIMVGLTVYGYWRVGFGAEVPSTFDLEGNVVGTQSSTGLFVLMPGCALFLVLVFAILPAIDPRGQNFKASQGLFFASWFGALLTMLVSHAMIIFSAVHQSEPDIRWVLATSAVLLIAVGNYMSKSRSTWFMGLRTPWTLSSEHAWTVANRVTGWLLVLCGLLSLAIGFFKEPFVGTLVMGVGAVVSCVIGVVVSYFAWRADPERG